MAQDIHLHNYQDDLDTDANASDAFTQSQNDDLAEYTGRSPGELREELKKVALDENDASGEAGDEDMREALEDGDEDLIGGK